MTAPMHFRLIIMVMALSIIPAPVCKPLAAQTVTDAASPKFGQEGWPEKAHDSIRQSIIKGDYLGAWRSVQLLKRTNVAIEYLDYYEKLSAMLAGACPFSLAPEPLHFDRLIRAYSARFYRKFNTNTADSISSMDQASFGIAVTSLNPSQTPYLLDINSTKLLRGKGCRLSRPTFNTTEAAEEAEFQQLIRYRSESRNGLISTPVHEVRVNIRLLELATRLKKSHVAQELINELAALEPAKWRSMSEMDRRFLWTMLQENGRVPAGVVTDGSPEDELIETIIRSSSRNEVSYWLGLAPLDQWSLKRKRDIFKAVDNLGPFPGRSAVILRRALIAYEEQKPRESLEFVRRILSSQESVGNDNMENFSAEESTIALTLQLVEKLLGEYKYDQAVVASIKTSVPSTYWRRVYRGLLLQYAIRGDGLGYNRLKTQLLSDNAGIWKARLTPETVTALDFMVKRSLSKLSKSLETMSQENRSEFIKLSKDVAIRISGYTDDDFRSVSSILNPFIPLLERDRASGRQSADTEDVIRILGRFRHDREDKTERAIHGGVSHVGAVNIRPLLNLDNPFVWVPLNRMPLTNLLAMPDEANGRGWSIQ